MIHLYILFLYPSIKVIGRDEMWTQREGILHPVGPEPQSIFPHCRHNTHVYTQTQCVMVHLDASEPYLISSTQNQKINFWCGFWPECFNIIQSTHTSVQHGQLLMWKSPSEEHQALCWGLEQRMEVNATFLCSRGTLFIYFFYFIFHSPHEHSRGKLCTNMNNIHSKMHQ